MKLNIHRADDRGKADYGWLKANYSFSFANYFNPERVHFGKLRVLNDDFIAPSEGFDTHPHDNMEIITIPLVGSLKHKDSMGSEQIIRKNDIQFMSAGTGVFHSEFSGEKEIVSNILQIWIFPKVKNIVPKYLQISLNPINRSNTFDTFVSPYPDSQLQINQDAFLSLSDLEESKKISYSNKISGNGIFIFVISGNIEIDGNILNERDSLEISESDSVEISARTNSEILVIEVPLK